MNDTDIIERAAKAYYEAEVTAGVFGSKPLAWETPWLRHAREKQIELMRIALDAAGLLPAALASFSVVTGSGYPELQHFPDEDADEGCFLMFADAVNLDELTTAARAHRCESGGAS
jgi:hypothetical protein